MIVTPASAQSGASPGEAAFRTDINGLRAWAVVAVILYHFGSPGAGGGFVGVDVFFVISGFLMTKIVVEELERTNQFLLAKFYLARARRIVPALAVQCVALLGLGWQFLVPSEYRQLALHALLSVAFLSNFKFWREAGYFDDGSHDKWLLHTWSLAVEWQFYVILPIALMLLWRLRPARSTILMGLLVGFLASLGLSTALTPPYPSASFYLLHTRAWEMLAGGLAFMASPAMARLLSGRARVAMETIGFTLIIGAVVGFDSDTPWPGWRPLVPVAGAFLVLVVAMSRSWWTGMAVAQWLGLRSYSLYLWHWPLLVALAYVGQDSNPAALAACMLATIAAAHISYSLVEVPGRRLLRSPQGRPMRVLIAVPFVVMAMAAIIRLEDGFTHRATAQVAIASGEAANRNPLQERCHISGSGPASPSCTYGKGPVRAILIGDSHANAIASALAEAASLDHAAVREWSRSNCPTLQGVRTRQFARADCANFVDWVLQELAVVPRDVPVVIVNRTAMYAIGANEDVRQKNKPWVFFSRPYATAEPVFLREYAKHLTDTACLIARERVVYMVKPIPEMQFDVPRVMARALMLGTQRDISLALEEYRTRQNFVSDAMDAARTQCGVRLLDPIPYLCRQGSCPGAKGNRPLYYDTNHLSEYGNRLLVPMFAEVFQPQQAPAP